MDPAVLAALQRWPNVPAAYGWLSLDARGRWRLHPGGGAHRTPSAPGQTIGNAALRAFIDRNYGCDARGRWFFQNGPQRVYVRLDAAPWVLRLADDGVALQTHTGLPVAAVARWLVDADGHLYAATPHGAGRVDDRDLAALLVRLIDTRLTDTHLTDTASADLLDALERGASGGTLVYPGLAPAPWQRVTQSELPALLDFDPNPLPEKASATASDTTSYTTADATPAAADGSGRIAP